LTGRDAPARPDRRRLLRAAPAGLALLLAGCGGTSAPPADSFYRLRTEDPGRRYGEPLLPGTLEVNRLSADGVTGERAIVYAEGGPKLRRYSYEFWVDSPGRMIQQALVDALRGSGAAATVATPALRLLADWRLEGTIERLEHRLIGADRAEAVLALELSVVNARNGDLVLLDDFQARRALSTQRVEPAVQAFNRSLTACVTDFLDRLETAAQDIEAPRERGARRS
jgi:cholesterol transport system auxiliary component